MDGDVSGPDPFNLPPESVTNGQLFIALQQLNTRVAMQNHELVALRREVQEQKSDTRDLVAAWKAGGTLLSIVKLLGVLATAALSTYGAYKLAPKLWG